jgi:hypothetical protein
MGKRSTIVKGLVVLVLATFLAGCAAVAPKPSEKNFTIPKVTVSLVEIPYYTGYWYFAKKVEPTKGTAGDYGAPMGLAFIFDVENPNPYPVLMEGLKFTVAFEGFDLNTVSAPEAQWIPAGKTNHLRVDAMFDARSALLSLMVTGGFKLKEMGITPWDALEKWWTAAASYTLPVEVKEGTAIFKADGLTKVATFGGVFP